MNAIFRHAILVLLCLCAISAMAGGNTEQALWRTQEINFIYRGYMTTYDCRTLSTKVSRLLLAVGARQGTSVKTEACNVVQPFGGTPTQLATMRLSVTSPARANAEMKSEIARDSSRRTLLSRLGVQIAPAEEFLAFWASMDVARIEHPTFSASDCELLEQFAAQVLPKMAIAVEYRKSCSSSPHRLSKPTLKVLALLPMPPADAVRGSDSERG
jgi:hypothetical protein